MPSCRAQCSSAGSQRRGGQTRDTCLPESTLRLDLVLRQTHPGHRRCGWGLAQPRRSRTKVVKGVEMTKCPGFDESERQAVYRAIRERRDVRRGFLPEPMPDELLGKLLEAAHNAPSVGLMQPWRFIIVRSLVVRQAIHKIFLDANQQALAGYEGEQRQNYSSMK